MSGAYTDAMIDLETLDTRPSAVIVSIGVVVFNRRDSSVPMKKLYLTFGKKEFRDEQILMGRTVSRDTVIWWKKQEPAAKKVFKESNVDSISDALDKLETFLTSFDVTLLIWGNGAGFDNVITTSLYESYGRDAPWKFWNDRCFRTFKGEHGHIARPPTLWATKHNALDDARQQSLYLQAMYEELQKYNIQSFKDRQ